MQEGEFIFISHVEKDEEIALKIAEYLEKDGYKTWYYQRDSIPGSSYLNQIVEAIQQSSAIILIISPNSLKSFTVEREVEYAYKMQKRFIPVLYRVSNDEIKQQKLMWEFFLGDFASIKIPQTDVEVILPRIAMGIKALGIKSYLETKTIVDEKVDIKENIQIEKKTESDSIEVKNDL